MSQQFLTSKPIPLELLPALLDAYKCVQQGFPRHAVRLPNAAECAFRDEDGWYAEAQALCTEWEVK